VCVCVVRVVCVAVAFWPKAHVIVGGPSTTPSERFMVCAPSHVSACHPPLMNQATDWAWAAAAWPLKDPSDTKSGAGSAAPASTGGLPDTGTWAQHRGFTQQSQPQRYAHVHGQDVASPFTAVQKEKMKLQKKMREIEKIEKLMTTQEKVDRLQIQKVNKKYELAAQLENVEKMEEDELQNGVEEQHQTESLEVMPEDHNVQQVVQPWSVAEFHGDQPQLQPKQLEQQQQNASDPKSETTRRRKQRKRAQGTTAPTRATFGEDTLLDRLQGAADERKEALNALRGSVVEHAFSARGCRALQQALQVADLDTASKLLVELHGLVRGAAQSPHANYVIQKIVEVMPPSHGSFVVKELKGVAAELARHQYGCRIFCRLVEHFMGEEFTELMTELLADAHDLSRHQFGHYVMQSVLEHGSQEHRKQLVAALCDNARRSAHHRWASHVIETALSYCAAEEQYSIAVSLGTWDEDANDAMVSLAQTHFGSFVIKALIRVPGEPGRVAWAHVQHARSQLEVNWYGKRVLESGAQRCRAS